MVTSFGNTSTEILLLSSLGDKFVKLMGVPIERGNYGDTSKDMVGICKNFLLGKPYNVKLTNKDNAVADQQFVDELIKTTK